MKPNQLKYDPHKSLAQELAELGVASEAASLGFIDSPLKLALKAVITNDPATIELKNKAAKLSKSNLNVMILGETGTGKELFAKIIHGNREGKFIGVNTAGIPESLLESEIFGHVKGAFTGAFKDRHGLLEEAENGTMFLDEIGDMPVILQAKLLRAVQEKKARRVGDSREYNLTCRFVAATHCNLSLRFRQDLYYRLCGSILKLPSLIERFRDWELITKQVLNLSEHEIIPKSLWDVLIQQQFKGNIRQLINIIEEWKALREEENN